MGADVNWWWPQQVGRNIECHWSPSDDKKSFIDTERDIGETWRCELKQSMMEAGQREREREIAIQKVIFMRQFLPLPLSSMEDGVKERINTLIMPSLEW